MNRRGFLLACGTGLAAGRPPAAMAQGRAVVEATPTLFHGHPDGVTTLVRFSASGIDAPAGRLRVHDVRTGSLLGTAGMIRREDRLDGELWLPLTQSRRIRSELETPASRGVVRSMHDLSPTPRWTIYWLTLAPPDAVRAAFASVPTWVRAADAHTMVTAGVRVNPWHALPPHGDHLDLVRLTIPAAAASRVTGIPLARIALVDGTVSPHVARALRGAAVPLTLPRSRVVDPRALDLSAGLAAAMARIAAWLRARASLDVDQPPLAIAIGGDLDFALGVQANIDAWNTAFSFPRFAVGDGDEVLRVLAATPPDGDTQNDGGPGAPASAAPADEPGDPATAFLPLTQAAAPEDPTVTGMARHFAAPVSGLLVFNPSPFGRSGVVRVAERGMRVVTDVPGLGYAFVPDAPAAEVVRRPDAVEARSSQFSVQLDRSSGAITSVVHRATGRELVARGATVNHLPDAVLSAVHAETIADVGTRLVIRRVTARDVLTTTVTVYDQLPWVDVENQSDSATARQLEWTFAFAHPTERVVWEVPGGTREAEPPTDGLRPIRWTALRGGEGTVLLGSQRATGGWADVTGRLMLRAPGDTAFRIGYQRGHVLPDDPWRFGFAMRPFIAVPVAGTGDRTLPTFGRMLDIADPTVAVLAVRPAEDGVGVMVFLQELGGPARDVVVRPGVLAFDTALLTDLAERDLRAAAPTTDGGVLVPIGASDYAAVRLLGVRIGR